jgi:splicing factor 3B subunit 3
VDSFDSHIVVSLASSTLVLGVGDTIEEVSDSGFQLDIPTLAVGVLRDNSRLQVHSRGVRHIRAGSAIIEWKSPGGREVEMACVNSSQLVLALASSSGHGSELLVFELDDVGQLAEMGSLEVSTAVASLDVMVAPEGRSRAPFLAVGFLDETVQIMSLEPSGESLLSQRALIAVDSRPDSLCFVRQTRDGENTESLLLNIGLQTGVLHRLTVDQLSGSLADSRQRFLGTRSPRLKRLSLHQSGAGEGLLCLSTRAWMSYALGPLLYHVPLCYDTTIDNAASFSSDACPEGLVVTAGNSLRILSVDTVGSVFDQQSLPLPYTPRKVARTDSGLLVIVASDQHAFTAAEKAQQSDIQGFISAAAADTYGASSAEDEEDEEGQHMPLRGPVPELGGKWASCITVVNPSTNEKTELELQDNEAAFSVCACSFRSAARSGTAEQSYIVVGTAVGMTLQPRKAQQYFLRTYQLNESMELSLVHCTAVEEMPLCLAPFRGCLLAGVGTVLRMYDLGLKQLLVKCEARGFPSAVARVDSHGDRVFVGDMSESVLCVKYRQVDNCLVVFADDSVPRWINTLCALDHRTVAGSDKFGNVFVLRVPEGTDDDTDPSAGSRALWDVGGRNKLVQECHYYVGDMVTSLRKVQFVPGGPEILLAATISGELHALLPLSSKGDVDFFCALEAFLREQYAPLCGRVHLSYRSYYQPVRNLVDGDLCERYGELSYNAKSAFAEEQGRSVPEVLKKLSEVRDVL